MKRIISLLLAVLLLATVFCGCSGSGEKDSSSANSPATSSEDPTTSSEPEPEVPTVEFADLETFEGAAALLTKRYDTVPFWKNTISGATVKLEKVYDPFSPWRYVEITFEEGTALKLLGIDAPVHSVYASAGGNDCVNSVKIYYSDLSDDNKALLEEQAEKLDSVSVKETGGGLFLVNFAE